MLKLAFVLIGPDAFRSRWYMLAVTGVVVIALGALLAIDVMHTLALIAYGVLGLIFIGAGLAAFLVAGDASGQRFALLRGGGLVLTGGLILAALFQNDWHLALLFALAFALDGSIRLASALIFRFPGWRFIAVCGLGELVLTTLLLTDWPLPHGQNVPLCVGLFIVLSGWLLLRFGLLLRTLEDEVAILMLPVFAGRGWYDHAPVLIGEEPARRGDEAPLIVHVWTPAASANARQRRPIIDRYLIAVGSDGNLSTGHASLEMPPNLYISHYPAVEHAVGVTALHAGAANNIPGRFLTSYAEEVADWCPADAHVVFHNFSARRLSAFWIGYRQDATYNLANRNCSIVVAAALDAALEGALARRTPWLRLIRLLLNPDMWAATMIRSRAMSMTWTPGLVLDYARVLARIVDQRDLSWSQRFTDFLARLRAGDDNIGVLPS
ncbi:MAG: protease [Ancylobacter novellus]|uniref:Protease n=1 Tax=Ancylobacter novellus TaxID=921 RepID=A0A2W5TFD9_ANCNO|nr:MAG: protease [Ancylobacter novellus]